MNLKSIYKVIVSGEKGPRIVGRAILGVILVATFLLTAAIIYSRAANPQTVPGISVVEASLASNPELMLARRYAADQGQMLNQASLAANPELALANRFAAVKKPAETSLLAANRELSFARHNGINQNLAVTDSYLSTAAELRQAQLYAAHRWDGQKAPSLTANPELALVRRFASGVEKQLVASPLADNPELALARRNAAVSQNPDAIHADASANPELFLARRFGKEGKEMEKNIRWEYLSENPELFLVHRYLSLTKK